MPVVDGVKMACEICLRGHRGAVCKHPDRTLYPVRPKGRPSKHAKVDNGSRNKANVPSRGVLRQAKPSSRRSKPKKNINGSRCCERHDCQCVHVEGELMESHGCGSCGPGLAQQDFMSPPAVLSPLSPVSSSSKMTLDGPIFSNASPSGYTSTTGPPAPFDFELPCTCPDPCPCPGCPAHPKGDRPAAKKGVACCSKEEAKAVRVTDQHCVSCLPCIIAPFEQTSPLSQETWAPPLNGNVLKNEDAKGPLLVLDGDQGAAKTLSSLKQGEGSHLYRGPSTRSKHSTIADPASSASSSPMASMTSSVHWVSHVAICAQARMKERPSEDVYRNKVILVRKRLPALD